MSEEQFAAWMEPKESRAEKLLPLITSYPMERMEMWPVGERVNSVKEDSADLLARVDELPKPTWTQPSLFDDEAA